MLQLNNSFKSFGVRSKDQNEKAKNKLILGHTPMFYIFITGFSGLQELTMLGKQNVTLPKNAPFRFCHFFFLISLKFIRLLRIVFSSQQRVTEGVITTRSNRMKFRLLLDKQSNISFPVVSRALAHALIVSL